MRYFSHSALSTFEQCAYRYKLAYVDHLPRRQSIAALRGSAAHVGIEHIYREVMKGHVPALSDAIRATHAWWRLNLTGAINVPGGGGSAEDYLAEALACVTDYYESHYPFDEDETIALEKRVAADLNDRIGIAGYMDRLARRAGQYEIHDFKTSRAVPRDTGPRGHRQLVLYAIGLQREIPDAEAIKLVWHYVLARETRIIEYRAEKYTPLVQATVELIQRIQQEQEYPRVRTGLCKWCDFGATCESGDQEGKCAAPCQ